VTIVMTRRAISGIGFDALEILEPCSYLSRLVCERLRRCCHPFHILMSDVILDALEIIALNTSRYPIRLEL
jgi:hypothetical protein